MGIAAFAVSLVLNPILKGALVTLVARYLPPLIRNAFVKNSFFITVTLVFTLFFVTYNAVFWKAVTKISRGGMPNLQGAWIRTDTAAIEPESEEYTENLLTTIGKAPHLMISQTWTEIEVAYIDLDKEYWRSDSAALHIDDGPNPELICTFQSESYDDIPVDFDRGTLRVRYFKSDGVERLVGYQYTDSTNEREKVEFERRHKSFWPTSINIESSDK